MAQAEKRREARSESTNTQPHNSAIVGNESPTPAVPATYPPPQTSLQKPSIKTNWSGQQGTSSSPSSSVDSLRKKSEASDSQNSSLRND
jgi:hypothetical protein